MSLARRLRRMRKVPDVLFDRRFPTLDAAIEALQAGARQHPDPRKLAGWLDHRDPKRIRTMLVSRAHALRVCRQIESDYLVAALATEDTADVLRILQFGTDDEGSSFPIQINPEGSH